MNPEKALAILEGKIPHKEPPDRTVPNEKKMHHHFDPESKDIKITKDMDSVKVNKTPSFLKILGIVSIVGILIVFYLWNMAIVSEKSYKKGFNAGTSSINDNLTAAQKDIINKVQQIDLMRQDLESSKSRVIQLQKDIVKTRENLGLLVQQKEQLAQSLQQTQESIPVKISTLNNQLSDAQKVISDKENQLSEFQKSIAQSERERDRAQRAVADKEQQLTAAQKNIDDKVQQIEHMQQDMAKMKQNLALIPKPIDQPDQPAQSSKESTSDNISAVERPLQKPANEAGPQLNTEGQDSYNQSIPQYTKAIDLNPNDINARINRGLAYEDRGDYDKAVSDFNKALKINPNEALCFYRLGDVYYLKGKHAQAVSNWNKAIRLDSQNAFSNITYYHKGNYDKVISENTKVIKIYPDYSMAYYMRGAAYGAKSKHDKAIADLSRAIQLNPKYMEAYSDRAIAYFIKGEYNKALEDTQKAQQLGGNVNLNFVNSLKIALDKKY